MDAAELWNSCPPMDYAALEAEILGTVLARDNYLFFRTSVPPIQFAEETATGWEMYCTACHRPFWREKKRNFKPGKLEICPECGSVVTAKKWMENRKTLRTRLLYYTFQRGEGRRVWLRAYAVTHDFCPAPGDERLEFFEMSRYLFDDGFAQKWAHSMAYMGRMMGMGWTARKKVTKTVWQQNAVSGLPPYPAFVGAIDWEVVSGSCLEYSQLDRAIKAGIDIPEYIAFYLKNPMIEYLWKFGFEKQITSAFCRGGIKEMRQAVNFRAKRPRDMLRGLTVDEARQAAKKGFGVIALYEKLKKGGIVHGSDGCWDWARAAYERHLAVEQAEAHGMRGKALRSYIERQAAHADLRVATMLSDYGDYLRQIDQLGGGEVTPDDLRLAHERLSVRIETFEHAEMNWKFRARRRMLEWVRWRHDGMMIRLVDSVQEITREGERQRNCVANYAKRHADGKTIICVLRRSDAPHESWHTVELNPRTLDVVQCRGYRNSEATAEAQAFVNAWCDRLKTIRGVTK